MSTISNNISSTKSNYTYTLKTKTTLPINFGNQIQTPKDVIILNNSHFQINKALEELKQFKFYDDGKGKQTAKEIAITEYKPIQIKNKNTNKKVEAFMTTTKRQCSIAENLTIEKIGLFVFSKEGHILGNIESLDEKEHLDGLHFITAKLTGKYLRLHNINASYSNDYKGIGTALIEEAKKKSLEMRLGGQLHVLAHNVYKESSSRGRPNIFYAKMGFIDIQKPFLKKEKFNSLGDAGLYLLTPKNLKKIKLLSCIRLLF